MTAEEIMTLGDVGQELTLLEKNQSPLSEAGINKAIDFCLGEHPIKRDPNLEDEWIKEKHIDPQTNAVTWVNRKQTHTKLCLPYAQQIVMTASAFLIGKGLNLVFHSMTSTRTGEPVEVLCWRIDHDSIVGTISPKDGTVGIGWFDAMGLYRACLAPADEANLGALIELVR